MPWQALTARLLMTTDIKVATNALLDLRVQHVGREQTPILIIDDLLLSATEMRRLAKQQAQFKYSRNSGYPGVRAALPIDYNNAVVPPLLTVLHQVYNVPQSFIHELLFAWYSLVTKPPPELSLLQRIPHFDSTNPFYFASVHYLNPNNKGGTGIFHHRPTGFERITAERVGPYFEAAKAFIHEHGEPSPEYINSSNKHFELIAEVPYKPNRMVCYPGNLLHSGLVEPTRDIDSKPDSGRLTANLFLDFRASLAG